ncbi:MAG TPA: hypothetical protein VJH03_00945 [Blastocatellia bacterium]|nr:hypothetical protein [Blastocatellia bacterium]
MPNLTLVRSYNGFAAIRRSLSVAGLIALSCCVLASAQRRQEGVAEIPRTVIEGGLSLHEIHKLPGQLLSQGRNNTPAGQLRLRTYRLEEVPLPLTIKTQVEGQMVEVARAWRLTVTGGPFTVRNAPAVISIDGVPVGIGVESPDLRRLTVITFDRALLHEGGTISVSYGSGDDSLTDVPDKLRTGNAR